MDNGTTIKVYYVKDSFGYTIEYYYDGSIDSTKTVTGTAEYQSQITTYTDKNITGYKLDHTEGLPLTIGANASNNVIKVYYIKDTFGYRVEYYYGGSIDSAKTENLSAEYGSTINTYPDKNITGYKLDYVEGTPLTIGTNVANNIIKVYYIVDDGNTKTLSYTVEYYKDNVKVDGDDVTKTFTVQVLAPNTISIDRTLIENNNKYVGYKLDHTVPASVPNTVDNGTTIKVYYVKDTFSYRVEY